MPSIIVTADTDSARDDPRAFQFKERVRTSDLGNPHFASQLVERIGCALADAEEAERAGAAATWQPPTDSRLRITGRTPSRVRNE